MTELRKLHGEPDQNCIQILEMALEEARAGKLSGCVILGAGPSSYCDAFEGGTYSLGDILYVFECYKTRAIERKLKEPTL